MSIASDFSIIPDSMVNMDEDAFSQLAPNVSFLPALGESMEIVQDSYISSTFNKVTFGAVQRVGNDPNGALSVVYSNTPDFVFNSSDRLALYKLGFGSSKEFLCFEWVIPDSQLESLSHPLPRTAIFKASALPTDEEELYQICYLMHDGRFAGASSPFRFKDLLNQDSFDEVDKAARNVLSIRVRELLEEQEELKENIKELEALSSDLKEKHSSVTQNCHDQAVELEKFKAEYHVLEEKLSSMELEYEKLKAELLETETAFDKEKETKNELQGRLAETMLEINMWKDKLSVMVEHHCITGERQTVLLQDNEELKICLKQLKENLEEVLKEKEAAEKIAADLSGRLQTGAEKYQFLSKVNLKLTKRLKKMKNDMALMESTVGESFLCVDGEYSPKGSNAGERDEGSDKDDTETVSSHAYQAVAMTMSTASCMCHSNCSHAAKELTEAFSVRMDDIMSQLHEQKEQIKVLKEELSERGGSSIVNPGTVNDSKPIRHISVGTDDFVHDEIVSKACSCIERININHALVDDKKVLYGHSFLPAQCTAPVFLPSSLDLSSIMPPSIHNQSNASHYLTNAPVPAEVNPNKRELPPPLLPETTASARAAAVLNQLNITGSTDPLPISCQHESDDDDYHSTSDNGETKRQNHNSLLTCPICNLTFGPDGIKLLNDHIDNHLDNSPTCPMCLVAFAKCIDTKDSVMQSSRGPGSPMASAW